MKRRHKRCKKCKKGKVQFMARKDKNDAVLYVCALCAAELQRQGYLIVSYNKEEV